MTAYSRRAVGLRTTCPLACVINMPQLRQPAPLRRAVTVLAAALGLASACGDDGAATTIRVLLRSGNPAVVSAVAYQDGDGPWTLIHEPGAMGATSWTFSASSGRYGLAFQCREFLGEVIYATTAEMSHVDLPCIELPEASATFHQVTGNLHGLADSDKATVLLGHGSSALVAKVTRTPDRFEVLSPSGSYDLVALAEQLSGTARVLVKHGIALTGARTLDLDFADARAPVERPTPVTTGAGPPGEMQVRYATAGGLGVPLTSTTPGTIRALASQDVAPGDRQELMATWVGIADSEMRGLTRLLGDAPPPSLEIPRALAATGLEWGASAAPIQRLRATFAPYPGATFYQLNALFMDRGVTAQRLWVVNASARWLGDRTAVEMPDLTHLHPNPFSPILAPAQGDAFLQAEVVAIASTRGMQAVLDDVAPASASDVTSYAKKIFLTAPPRP